MWVIKEEIEIGTSFPIADCRELDFESGRRCGGKTLKFNFMLDLYVFLLKHWLEMVNAFVEFGLFALN